MGKLQVLAVCGCVTRQRLPADGVASPFAALRDGVRSGGPPFKAAVVGALYGARRMEGGTRKQARRAASRGVPLFSDALQFVWGAAQREQVRRGSAHRTVLAQKFHRPAAYGALSRKIRDKSSRLQSVCVRVCPSVRGQVRTESCTSPSHQPVMAPVRRAERAPQKSDRAASARAERRARHGAGARTDGGMA